MAIEQLPISVGVPNYSFEVELDGVEFKIDLRYNDRGSAWFMTILDTDDNVLRSGIKVVNDWPLLRLWKDSNRPEGEIVTVSQGARVSPPTLDELGVDVVLNYLDATEIATIKAEAKAAQAANVVRADLGLPKPIPDNPSVIFGVNLTAWFDASFGVTISTGRVTDWEDRSLSNNDLTNGVPTALDPKYIASDVDGTPTVWYDPAETDSLQFVSAKSIGANTTAYVFMELPNNTGIKNLLWSDGGNIGFFPHASPGGNQRPGIFSGVWNQIGGSAVLGWTLLRFSANDVANTLTVAVNNSTESTFATAWAPGANTWGPVGRVGSLQELEGNVKQIFITNTYVTDASPEHQKVLDWIKYLYPSLVVY